MRQHLWTVAFLVLAIVLYSVGIAAGAVVMLALGFAAELVFWIRLFTRSGN